MKKSTKKIQHKDARNSVSSGRKRIHNDDGGDYARDVDRNEDMNNSRRRNRENGRLTQRNTSSLEASLGKRKNEMKSGNQEKQNKRRKTTFPSSSSSSSSFKKKFNQKKNPYIEKEHNDDDNDNYDDNFEEEDTNFLDKDSEYDYHKYNDDIDNDDDVDVVDDDDDDDDDDIDDDVDVDVVNDDDDEGINDKGMNDDHNNDDDDDNDNYVNDKDMNSHKYTSKQADKKKSKKDSDKKKNVPITQEMKREYDPSIVYDYSVGINKIEDDEEDPNIDEQTMNKIKKKRNKEKQRQNMLGEIKEEDKTDEFESYFANETTPKILLTTGLNGFKLWKRPSKPTLHFLEELLKVIPNAFYFKRKKSDKIQEIVEFAKKQDFTDVIVISERLKKPSEMILCHLPEGPTATFRITNTVLNESMKKGEKGSMQNYSIDKQPPEVIVNNFTTRLGLRVVRMLSALFPQSPDYNAKRAVTFHNQRDFIFFRHHFYEFDTETERCRLKEVGPRFTLRLERLQVGTFDPKFGNYEWFHRQGLDTSRTKFFL